MWVVNRPFCRSSVIRFSLLGSWVNNGNVRTA